MTVRRRAIVPSDYRQLVMDLQSDTDLMTVTSPRLILERMYRAEVEYLAAGGPGKASFATLAPFFAPDVVLWQADTLPYGGIWRGHGGMEQFFLAMSATWDRFEMTEQVFLSEMSPLIVLTHVNACSRDSGRELNFPILQTITVTEGLISEVRPFYWDTAAIVDACSVSDE
ncbi:nuclear transport factor 2 family protein [Nocardia carnea]|uniref:nuclear transport factor 2 family protein n=1 Tax=Nocardia carnea TaxID=37328 RepID=UPI0024556DEC|nr:nuclear transport factor 2 family protein [Nocardia carnea]